MHMQIVGVIIWWYTGGWVQAARRVMLKLDGLLDYFSIDLLIRTLFSPFRQISAGAVDGPIDIKVRAFFDKLISRLIGALVRLVVLLIGVLSIIVGVAGGLLYLLGWAVVPFLPVIGLIVMLAGWIPWKIL